VFVCVWCVCVCVWVGGVVCVCVCVCDVCVCVMCVWCGVCVVWYVCVWCVCGVVCVCVCVCVCDVCGVVCVCVCVCVCVSSGGTLSVSTTIKGSVFCNCNATYLPCCLHLSPADILCDGGSLDGRLQWVLARRAFPRGTAVGARS